MSRLARLGVVACLWLGCAARSSAPPAVATPRAGDDVPLYSGLGPHQRPVATKSPAAQRYVDQGLAFLFAFNHDESIRAFRKATALDPTCAMAFWGVAIANGPHINFPMVPEDRAVAAWEALGRARDLAPDAGEADRALIGALEKRYASPQPADRKPLDEAYAAAMRDACRAHPEDADTCALFAEALMDLRPWDLWTSDGKPQPGTDEILTTLQLVLERSPDHPLANHLYIHAVEASPKPQRADTAAERLRTLAPALGHLVHMPSHIDVRTGRWEQAITSNEKAMEADARYRESQPNQKFYRMYIAHNHHMLAFAAMMTARSELALRTIRKMVAEMPEPWVRENAAFVDGFVAMPFELLMRFGRWDEILAAPEPPEHLPLARALRLYARGVARAARLEPALARAEQKAFLEARTKVAADAAFGNNAAADMLAIAEHLLEGEILFREGKRDPALAAMREAVVREDKLRYDEPPDWIQPVRRALGAALLHAGRPAEAEAVYREDLARLPGNAWSLHGLARSLRLQKKDREAAEIERQLAASTRHSDIQLNTSCLCLPGV